jgi:hypothetical protein
LVFEFLKAEVAPKRPTKGTQSHMQAKPRQTDFQKKEDSKIFESI